MGPSLTAAAEAAAPVYENAGIADLVATAHGDDITSKGSTTFLMTVSTSDMGKARQTISATFWRKRTPR